MAMNFAIRGSLTLGRCAGRANTALTATSTFF
jgi:hypothetical protein